VNVNQQSDKRRKVDCNDQSLQVVAAAAPASHDFGLSISDDTIVGHFMDCSENDGSSM